jgi:hypothetical protein
MMPHTPFMGSPAHLAEIALEQEIMQLRATATSPPIPPQVRERWAEFLGSFGIPYASNYFDAFLEGRLVIHRYDWR